MTTPAREVDDDDDYVGKRDERAPSFIMGLFGVLPMLFWCFRGFNMLGRMFTPTSPIEEDDIVAAVGVAKGVGGGFATTGVVVVP